MDAKLVGWARAVKQRRRRRKLPVLWLFTDAQRLPDPLAAVARLPKGVAGVVLRHGGVALALRVAALCRERRLALVVAGDARLAARCGAGVHLRGGRTGLVKARGLVTSSAHNRVELRRARRAGANIVFLSPAFATDSHPGAPALGAARWAKLAGAEGAYALGGVDGKTVRALGRRALGVGAIGAMLLRRRGRLR
jgi:thiamine-phosphate pyrophosphorylase